MLRKLAVTGITSLLVHAAVLGAGAGGWGAGGWGARSGERAGGRAVALTAVGRLGAAALGGVRTVAEAARIRRAREALVEEARAELAAGQLALGRFLLRGNAIDAEAEGLPFDAEEAEARYGQRLGALREALRGAGVREAVPGVFGDVRYHGEPGGLMGHALLEGGGSCEQVAQLVAAAVYDAGLRDAIALRYYGGVMADGAAHLAPVAVDRSGEHDLMSGKPAVQRGARFPAHELVEAYARAHDLAPRAFGGEKGGGEKGGGEKGGGEKGGRGEDRGREGGGESAAASARPTLVAGFPPNADRYPGALPLYAARAIQEPGGAGAAQDGGEAAPPSEQGRDCAYVVRMAALRPPAIDVATGDGGALVAEPRRVPDPFRLEREAALLGAAGALVAEGDPADRLMGWACLAALGEVAAVDFALAGERRLAETATARARRAREEGRAAIAAVPWTGEEGARLRGRLSGEFGGRFWLLLFLEGGDRVVLDLVERGRWDDWGQVSALAALLLWPPTRARGLARVEALEPRAQIEVMHEIFHAHDHMRPWASNVDLGEAAGGAGASFLRAYRVFRGLAFRLWEGQRPVAELFEALPREARAAGLDAAWEAAILEYGGRNALGLHAHRASGLEVVRLVQEATARSDHPSLAVLRRQLAYIASQARLDATTLADALRLR